MILAERMMEDFVQAYLCVFGPLFIELQGFAVVAYCFESTVFNLPIMYFFKFFSYFLYAGWLCEFWRLAGSLRLLCQQSAMALNG